MAGAFPRLERVPIELIDAPRLRDVRGGASPVPPSPTAFPGPHCGLFEATLLSSTFPGSVTLFVGPTSCLRQAQLMRGRSRGGPPQRPAAFLCLEEHDLVLGFDDALTDAIREVADNEAPELVFVVTTCPPDITGTDVAAVAGTVGDLETKIAVVATNGFADLHGRLGTRNLLSSLVSIMQPQEVLENTVNVLGARPLPPHGGELRDVLAEAGVAVRAAVPGARTADIVTAPAASVNVVLDEVAEPLAQAMADRFGTPWVRFATNYDPEAVRAAYDDLGAALGVDLGAVVAQRHAATVAWLEDVRPRLAGATFAVGSVEGSAVQATALLASLGMVPCFVAADHLDASDRSHADALLADGHDPVVNHRHDSRSVLGLAARLRPQVFVGHAQSEVLASFGVAACHLSSFWTEAGYSGVRRAVANVLGAVHGNPEAHR